MTIGSAIIGVGTVHPINERVWSMKEVTNVRPTVVRPKGPPVAFEPNIYGLTGYVAGVLRMNGLYEREKEFLHRMVSLNTFEEVLELSREFIDIATEEDNVGSS